MPDGRITRGLWRSSMFFATTSFADYTGVSHVACLLTAFGAAIGSAYHLSRRAVKKLRGREADYGLEYERYTQTDLESTLRKLAGSFVGLPISIAFAVHLPHLWVGASLSTLELVSELRKLNKMRKHAGGTRALLRHVPKRRILLQITAGAGLKLMLTVVFLGDDFDKVVDGWSSLRHAGDFDIMVDGWSPLIHGAGHHGRSERVIDIHNWLIGEGGPLHWTTQAANGPVEFITQWLGESKDYVPTWHDGRPVGEWLVIGGANAAVDVGLAGQLEHGAHRWFDDRSRAQAPIDPAHQRHAKAQ